MTQAADLYSPGFHVKYISGRHISCPPEWRIDGFVLPFHKLYLITDGEMIVEMNEKLYRLRRGDMILIPKGVCHSMRHSEKKLLEKYYLHFSLNLSGSVNFFNAAYFSEGTPIVSLREDYDKIIKLLEDTFYHTDMQNRHALFMLINAACLTVVSYYLEHKKLSSTSDTPLFSDIIALMQENPCGLTLPLLAEKAYLSPEHFVRKFKKLYGVSPMKYYDRLRIDFATAAIREGVLSFNEIAQRLGISEMSYFSSFFKKHVGVPPGEYRKICNRNEVYYIEK